MKKIFSAIIILAMVFSLSAPVFATQYTWTGGGGADTDMDTNANWGGAGHPSFPADTVVFATSANHIATPSTVNAEQNANITFNSANDFTVAANGHNFGIGNNTPSTDGITAQNPDITADASSRIYTIAASVLLYDSQTWTVSNNGVNTTNLAVSGAIGQNGSAYSLTKSGTGTLTLTAKNTYTGGTTVNGGTLSINNPGNDGTSAIGSGTLTIGSGATVITGGQNNPFGYGAGVLQNIVINGGTLSAGTDYCWVNNITMTGAAITATGVGTDSLSMLPGGTNNTITVNASATTSVISVPEIQMQATTTTINVASGASLNISSSLYDSGNLTKTGGGVLTLSGNNNSTALDGSTPFSGTTTVSAGTLSVGNASALGAGTLTINGGTIDASVGGLTLNNNTQNWNSSFVFAGTNSLNLGTGAVTLGVTPTITVNNNTLTVGGVIGGAFGLTEAGAGILTLSGINIYTGATTINTGTLALDATGTIATSSGVADASAFTIGGNKAIQSLTGAGTVALGANTLTIGDANNRSSIFSGTVGGVGGGITTAGTGTLTLSGANTYSGLTTIGAGSTLQAGSAGALGASAVTNSSANGTLDIGTTSLALGIGSYTQGAATAKLKLTANSSSAFGNITSTTGVDHITNGLVNVNVVGYIPNGATLAIITGAAGSTYAPASITSTNSYVNFSGSTSNGIYTLTANRSGSSSFSGAAINSNAANVGGVLDNVNNPSTDMFTILTALGNSTPSQVAQSENSMSPTNDGALTQSAQAMLNNFTNNIESHLDNVRNTGGATGVAIGDDCLNGVDIWAQGLGDYAHQDPRGSSQGYNATSWGVSGGADKALYNDQIRVGFGSGYGQTSVNSKDFSGNTNINSIPVTIYADYTNNNLPYYIDAAFTFIYNMYNGSRQVMAGPTILRTANQDYDGEQYSGYLEGGYSFFYKKISLTPLASFQYAHLHTGSYTETNAGALDLSVASQDYDVAQTGFGAKLACPFDNRYGTLTPDLHFKWLYDWVGDNQASTASFAGGGSAFGTNGFAPAQSEWDFGARLDFKTKYNVTIGLDYDFLCKADYYEHYGTVDVKYSF